VKDAEVEVAGTEGPVNWVAGWVAVLEVAGVVGVEDWGVAAIGLAVGAVGVVGVEGVVGVVIDAADVVGVVTVAADVVGVAEAADSLGVVLELLSIGASVTVFE